MTSWFILRTDHSKEAYVARQIINAGFPAWVPAEKRVIRPQIARRVTAKAAFLVKDIPLLPRRLFAAVPVALYGDLLRIHHLRDVERNAAGEPLEVPQTQVDIFRAEIERLNTATLALSQSASRKQKAVWRSLKDALQDMIADARQQMEMAA